MASAPGCVPGRGGPSLSTAGARAGAASPRSRRRYTSLPGRTAFRRVYRTGRRVPAGGITVIVAPGPGPAPRVGVVASRAVGGAVQRNRARRRIKAALERVPVQRDVDLVVITSRKVNQADFRELVDWLSRAVGSEGAT